MSNLYSIEDIEKMYREWHDRTASCNVLQVQDPIYPIVLAVRTYSRDEIVMINRCIEKLHQILKKHPVKVEFPAAEAYKINYNRFRKHHENQV